ncbi:hypothetical protein FD754_019775 [Muntiacus muntjak]|uniref:Uncharacterized protein n=1 Tax=Muntiacus muntjak TaxID=9888 RepID=A0A5N3V1G2_MUNMU|nr:hypothetical protein FD754_019775 [Muntiacus muntjak]
MDWKDDALRSEDIFSGKKSTEQNERATDILGEAGGPFDELDKLQVLDPEVTQQTRELKEGPGGLIELVDQLAKEAGNEKTKQQLQALAIEYEALWKGEA